MIPINRHMVSRNWKPKPPPLSPAIIAIVLWGTQECQVSCLEKDAEKNALKTSITIKEKRFKLCYMRSN